MSTCAVCGNDYDTSFTVTLVDGEAFTFDSPECAIRQVAMTCAHGRRKILGHGVRWAYGEPSCHFTPDASAEHGALRAVAGVPVIVVSATFDVVTCPFQLLFGVWPMWGDSSTMMVPPEPPRKLVAQR